MLKITTVAALVLMATSALAAEPKVRVSGCTSGGVEGCLFLNTPSQRYALYVKPPRPALGRGVTVVGTIDKRVGVCMFQPAILVQKWNYNRMHCPK